MARRLAAGFALALAMSPALADFFGAKQLVEWADQAPLRNSSDPVEAMNGIVAASNFQQYVVGFHDAGDNRLFCTPQSVTVGQLQAVVEKYLRANPEQWHERASVAVTAALASAFPCKK